MSDSRVLVLNHFAAHRGEPGGTRHVELFSHQTGWEYLIITSSLNSKTGQARRGQSAGFVQVPVIGYSGNGLSRMLNWASYAVSATLKGLTVGKVNIVYGSSPHLLTALAAWVLSVAKGATFVLEIRDLWPKVLVDMNRLDEDSLIFRNLSQLEEFLYRRAKTIVVMAPGSRTHLLAKGVEEAKIAYIPNGADPEDFMASAPREELRRRYNFTRTTAVYAGAHGPANGLDLLLTAAEQSPQVDVVLVGGGVEKDALKARAERSKLCNVRFLDPVPKTEMPDILAAADVGLHVLADVELFRTAISPNKLYDYMAAGLVTLTNSPGLVAEILTESGAGFGVEPSRLADGLLRLAETPDDVRQSMGAAGREWIRKCQSRRAMAERLMSVLERNRP